MSDLSDPNLWTIVETRRRWSSSRGWEDVYVAEGPSEGLDNWLAQQPPGVTSVDIQTDIERLDPETGQLQGYARVTLTYASQNQDPPVVQPGEPPNQGRIQPPVWIVHLEEVEIGLLETEKTEILRSRDPNWVAQIVAHCEAWLAAAKKAAQEGSEIPPIPVCGAGEDIEPPPGATSEEINYANQLISLYTHNPDITKLTYAPVLEKIETLVYESTLAASYANVGKLYSWASLLNEVAASEGTSINECSLMRAPLIDDATKSNLSQWVWLKTAPEVRPASGGTWQITQRWKGYKSYEPYLYDLI